MANALDGQIGGEEEDRYRGMVSGFVNFIWLWQRCSTQRDQKQNIH